MKAKDVISWVSFALGILLVVFSCIYNCYMYRDRARFLAKHEKTMRQLETINDTQNKSLLKIKKHQVLLKLISEEEDPQRRRKLQLEADTMKKQIDEQEKEVKRMEEALHKETSPD
jgi:biopolymer transport protein ExbB/TolQ